MSVRTSLATRRGAQIFGPPRTPLVQRTVALPPLLLVDVSFFASFIFFFFFLFIFFFFGLRYQSSDSISRWKVGKATMYNPSNKTQRPFIFRFRSHASRRRLLSLFSDTSLASFYIQRTRYGIIRSDNRSFRACSYLGES